MIALYSGTPGSGKSLHVARTIKGFLFLGKPVICNFEVNTNKLRNKDKFLYLDNRNLTPKKLIKFSREYFENKPREDSILLVVDECQMMFNARSWDAKGRDEWNNFFQTHRHYGYYVILVAQFDRMIDRQIRSLIEYEYVHRKVSNMGIKGRFFSWALLSNNLMVAVKIWYPMKERLSSEFFRPSKRLYRLYDTYATFK